MFKPNLSYVLLFVENPIESAHFYKKLFGFEPVELQPTFSMFALPNGVMLGLWSRYTAEPLVTATPGAAEICFSTEDVDALYEDWGNKGITMIQKPTDMDFGRTFVALDLDGHRIRAFKLAKRA
ncbi:MAG TPA: VOC family protein [Candidatus Babeliales bacterium]|nr:VOC family protein [Candidatus Babeliales bacterium]